MLTNFHWLETDRVVRLLCELHDQMRASPNNSQREVREAVNTLVACMATGGVVTLFEQLCNGQGEAGKLKQLID